MKKLNVIYAGWGEHFHFGSLAEDGAEILFEYTAQALERGLECSPFKVPLSRGALSKFPEHQLGLPGMVSDALPDGWGMLLMDRLFRKRGRERASISPLDRLAFIGDKAMGAFLFEPSEDEELEPHDVDLLEMAQNVRDIFEGDSEQLLLKLALMGGSPHGARPKILVNFDNVANKITNGENGSGKSFLIKFPAQNEHKEVCAIEEMYSRIARKCGLEMPSSKYFDLGKNMSAFGIERFDRSGGMRVPMHTAAGAAHVDFRMPQLDYVSLLRLTQRMTLDMREVLKVFERCVFNVAFNNRDDHSKNFSFLMSKEGRWRLSPAYDLSFNLGPCGEHQMDICGEARTPTRENLLQLAKKNNIAEKSALEVIDRMMSVAEKFDDDSVEDLPIRKKTLETMRNAIQVNCRSLM